MAKKILFINQEVSPYVGESELSLAGLSIPQRCIEEGLELRTFMPKWGNINERRGQLHEVIRLSGMNLIINDTDHPLIIKVATVQPAKVQVYFIDNEDYFSNRLMGQDGDGNDYDDNGERAVFYARGVLETVKKLRWVPDIIHCQGWISALVPMYVKIAYHDEPSFRDAKVVTSLFNKGFSATLSPDFKQSVMFRDINEDIIGKYNDIVDFDELNKMAIDYSDAVIEAGSNVEGELLGYAAERNIPILRKSDDNFANKCLDFYAQWDK